MNTKKHNHKAHNHEAHNHETHNHETHNHEAHNHETHNHETHNHEAHNHEAHNHETHNHETHNHEAHSHDHTNHHKMMIQDFKKRFIISTIITLPVLILSPLIQNLLNYSLSFTGDTYLLRILSSFIFFRGGRPFLKGIVVEIKKKRPGMMTLIALAISVAYIYSTAVVFGLQGKFFFWELATLIIVMLLGHRLEMKSILGASKALEKLAELLPNTANIIKGNTIIAINIKDLKPHDKILVKAGEKIPADGIVIKGISYTNESMLTGESKPIKKTIGSKVIAGSINGDSVLEIQITNSIENSYLSKVIHLVKEAQKNKSKTEQLADIAARRLTLIAIIAGIGTFTYRYIYGPSLAFAIERLATVMVIACPHALGLAIPLVNSVSTSKSAKKGLLIRNRTAFENARKISTIVFDKTGTLTKGNFNISSITTFNNKYTQKELIQLTASLEKKSEHPIAQGIMKKAKELNTELLETKNFKVLKGEGVEGIVNKKHIQLISAQAIQKRGVLTKNDKDFNSIATQVFVVIENEVVAEITLEDQIREESFEAIKSLQSQKIKCYMLTGDNKKIAKDVATKLKLDGYFAEVLPDQKQQKIQELQNKGEFVAMTGDGINDAPALASADIGIAIGSGTDIANETADIILVNSNPKDIVSLIQFGKLTYKKMIQNLFWATGYNAFTIPLAAGVLVSIGIVISPAIGAALMSLSTIIVAINAKLLKLE